MKKMMLLFILLFVALPVFAANITIEDGNYRTTETGIGQGAEDQETEPGMTNNQSWDLEGFFFEDSSLSMVGGFNFKIGQADYSSGDIFISIGDAPQYGDIHRGGANGSDPQGTSGTYGYEYVLDLEFSSMTYSVLGLSDDTLLQTAYYQQNEGSSPWKYVSDGVATAYGGSFTFISGLTDDYTGFDGGVHYALTGFDLSFLDHGTNFYSHFTMGCGNDNLMGKGTVVPEPTTMVLLGSGLIGLAFYRRKMKK